MISLWTSRLWQFRSWNCVVYLSDGKVLKNEGFPLNVFLMSTTTVSHKLTNLLTIGVMIKIHNLCVAYSSPLPFTRKNLSPQCPLSVHLPRCRQLLPTSGPVGVFHLCMNKGFPSYKWSSNRRRSSLLLANHLCEICPPNMMLCSLLGGKYARGSFDPPHGCEMEGRSVTDLCQARGIHFLALDSRFLYLSLLPDCFGSSVGFPAYRPTSGSALGCSQA